MGVRFLDKPEYVCIYIYIYIYLFLALCEKYTKTKNVLTYTKKHSSVVSSTFYH
jgi:hypothetical protein